MHKLHTVRFFSERKGFAVYSITHHQYRQFTLQVTEADATRNGSRRYKERRLMLQVT